jgi:hypothetical protein
MSEPSFKLKFVALLFIPLIPNLKISPTVIKDGG